MDHQCAPCSPAAILMLSMLASRVAACMSLPAPLPLPPKFRQDKRQKLRRLLLKLRPTLHCAAGLQVRKVARRAAAFRASRTAEDSLHDQLDTKRLELETAVAKKVCGPGTAI